MPYLRIFLLYWRTLMYKYDKLSNVTTLISRGVQPAYDEKGILVFNQRCIRDNIININESRITNPEKRRIASEKILKKYDVLVNSTGVGTLGRVAQIKEINSPATVDSHVTIVRPDLSLLDGLYFGYSIIYSQPIIEAMGEGSTGQTELSRKRLGDQIEVPIPPLETQKRISSILAAYDDLIKNNYRRIEIIEKIAQIIHNEWFFKFKFPGHENVDIIDSELGIIPETWKIGKIGDLYSIKSGFAFKSKDFSENEGYSVIKIKNIENRSIDVVNCDNIPYNIAKDISKYELFEGDLLIAMTGAKVGKIGIMPKIDNKFFLNQRVGKFYPKIKINNYSFIYFHSISPNFQKEIHNRAYGAAQPNISGRAIESINIPFPPLDLIHKYTNIVDGFIKQINILRYKNHFLQQKRDLILPKLVSGQIKLVNHSLIDKEVET